jgi:hypothetical protein
MPCSHTSREFDKVMERGNSTLNKKHKSHIIETDWERRIVPTPCLINCGIILNHHPIKHLKK